MKQNAEVRIRAISIQAYVIPPSYSTNEKRVSIAKSRYQLLQLLLTKCLHLRVV
jgi:hypothetical protein